MNALHYNERQRIHNWLIHPNATSKKRENSNVPSLLAAATNWGSIKTSLIRGFITSSLSSSDIYIGAPGQQDKRNFITKPRPDPLKAHFQ